MVARLADSGAHVDLVRLLRAAALAAVVAGATGSLALMLYVGRRNPSRMLLLLFTLWVLSPFVGLALAAGRAQPWSVATRSTIHLVTLIVAVGSFGDLRDSRLRASEAHAGLCVPRGSPWVLAAHRGNGRDGGGPGRQERRSRRVGLTLVLKPEKDAQPVFDRGHGRAVDRAPAHGQSLDRHGPNAVAQDRRPVLDAAFRRRDRN